MNETLGNLVGLTLQHGSYETRRTTNPQECRDIVSDWAPHIAFLDLDLYEQFIDIVGRGLTHGHTPIIAFTRRRDTRLKLSAYERGADDIVEVPFTLDEIVARPFAQEIATFLPVNSSSRLVATVLKSQRDEVPERLVHHDQSPG